MNIGAIVRDFQNQALQDEWDQYRKSVLIQRTERSNSIANAHQELQYQHQQQMMIAAQKHEQLDQIISELNANFIDEAIALQYDASNLLEKFEIKTNVLTKDAYDGIEKDSKPLPCLGQRAHWIDCQKKYAKDPRPCHAYVDELEKCVTSTISKVKT